MGTVKRDVLEPNWASRCPPCQMINLTRQVLSVIWSLQSLNVQVYYWKRSVSTEKEIIRNFSLQHPLPIKEFNLRSSPCLEDNRTCGKEMSKTKAVICISLWRWICNPWGASKELNCGNQVSKNCDISDGNDNKKKESDKNTIETKSLVQKGIKSCLPGSSSLHVSNMLGEFKFCWNIVTGIKYCRVYWLLLL